MLEKMGKNLLGLMVVVGVSFSSISQAVIVDDITLPPMLRGPANTISVPSDQIEVEMSIDNISSNNVSGFTCVDAELTEKKSLSGILKIAASQVKLVGVCYNSSAQSDKIEIVGKVSESLVRLSGKLISDTLGGVTVDATFRLNGKSYNVELKN